jgi:hypothetical protein
MVYRLTMPWTFLHGTTFEQPNLIIYRYLVILNFINSIIVMNLFKL